MELILKYFFVVESVQISTVPASKVYLNLDCDAVNEMRQRLVGI